jgi:hypothetical protein
MAKAKAIIEELESPLTLADASELVVVKLKKRLEEIDAPAGMKFDAFWAKTFIDLIVYIVEHCEEQNVAETLYDIEKAPDGLRARVLRRRLALSLPPGTKNQLDEGERYDLADDMLEAGIATVKDVELWDALWGRKAEWSTVIRVVEKPVLHAVEKSVEQPVETVAVPDQPAIEPS